MRVFKVFLENELSQFIFFNFILHFSLLSFYEIRRQHPGKFPRQRFDFII